VLERLPEIPLTTILVGLAVALLVMAALTWAHLVFWRRRLSIDVVYEDMHRLPTPDGSAIELRRLPRPGAPAGPPCLLVHGLGANHRNLDVHPDRSLARHLSDAGHRDVWVVTLRTGRTGLRLRERLDFSSMVAHDLPLAVAEVRRRTDASQVDLIGFSMGGMLLLAALGRTLPIDAVRRAVLIGTPGRVGVTVAWVARLAPPWFPGTLPFRWPAQALAFIAGRIPTPFHRIVYDPANTPPKMVSVAMMDALADLPAALYNELTRMARSGGEIVVGGRPVLEGLGDVATPALFVAGDQDRLAPPASVQVAFDAWGARREDAVDKRFLVLGSEAAGHYGHGDLVIGRDLPDALYAPVTAFLSEGRGGRGSAGRDDPPAQRLERFS